VDEIKTRILTTSAAPLQQRIRKWSRRKIWRVKFNKYYSKTEL